MSKGTDIRDQLAAILAEEALEHVKGCTAVKVNGNFIVLTVNGVQYSVVVSRKRLQQVETPRA